MMTTTAAARENADLRVDSTLAHGEGPRRSGQTGGGRPDAG